MFHGFRLRPGREKRSKHAAELECTISLVYENNIGAKTTTTVVVAKCERNWCDGFLRICVCVCVCCVCVKCGSSPKTAHTNSRTPTATAQEMGDLFFWHTMRLTNVVRAKDDRKTEGTKKKTRKV